VIRPFTRFPSGDLVGWFLVLNNYLLRIEYS
jgi:hypothetical protein